MLHCLAFTWMLGFELGFSGLYSKLFFNPLSYLPSTEASLETLEACTSVANCCRQRHHSLGLTGHGHLFGKPHTEATANKVTICCIPSLKYTEDTSTATLLPAPSGLGWGGAEAFWVLGKACLVGS